MDSELDDNSESLSIDEFFELMCPVYMSWGMSYEEYWHGDVNLVKYYRKAHELKLREQNAHAHKQGMYIYEAFLIALNRSFGNTKESYPKLPYPMTEEEAEQRREEEKRQAYEQSIEDFKAMVEEFNSKKRGD